MEVTNECKTSKYHNNQWDFVESPIVLTFIWDEVYDAACAESWLLRVVLLTQHANKANEEALHGECSSDTTDEEVDNLHFILGEVERMASVHESAEENASVVDTVQDVLSHDSNMVYQAVFDYFFWECSYQVQLHFS